MEAELKLEGVDIALLREGLATRDQIDTAREESHRTDRPVTSVLVELGVLSQNSLFTFLRSRFGLEAISLRDVQTPVDVMRLIPHGFAMRHRIAPIRLERNTLVVAMEDPTDRRLIEDLRNLVGYAIHPALATSADIDLALTRYPDLAESAIPVAPQRSWWYRIARYAAFPILLPLPIGLLLGGMAQSVWPEIQQTLFRWIATGFSFGVTFCVIWGVWAVGLWYVNGLVFPPENSGRRR